MRRYNNFRGKSYRSGKRGKTSSFKAGYYAGLKAGKRGSRTRRTFKKRWY